MWLFLEKRRMRKEEKLAKMERNFAQKYCPHDYQIILNHKVWRAHSYDHLVDVWCPICEHTWANVTDRSWTRWKNKRDIRDNYQLPKDLGYVKDKG